MPDHAVHGSPTWRSAVVGRLLGGPGRIAGVDVARGIAVLGMFAAHIGVMADDWTGPSGWLNLAHGRSSILFATVAGLSLALVTGRTRPFTGADMTVARSRVLVRAACLFVVGALLEALGTRVYVILGFYAVYFVLAVPVLRWRVRSLAAAAGTIAVVGPPLAYWGPEALARAGLGTDVVTHYLLTGHYPAVVWMAYVLAGLAIGRCAAPTSARVRAGLILGGGGVAAVCAATSALLVRAAGGSDTVRATIAATTSTWRPQPWGWDDPWPPAGGLFLAGPHDDTFLEVVGSGGFAVMVIGLCLCVGRAGARVLAPLAAAGSMALTVYTLQLLSIWRWNLLDVTTNVPLAAMSLATLAGATAWRALLGKGPLERVVARVATSATATRWR